MVAEFLATSAPPAGQVYSRALAAFEIPLLRQTLRHCEGNQVKAAAMLGINRNTLRKKLLEHGIDSQDLD